MYRSSLGNISRDTHEQQAVNIFRDPEGFVDKPKITLLFRIFSHKTYVVTLIRTASMRQF